VRKVCASMQLGGPEGVRKVCASMQLGGAEGVCQHAAWWARRCVEGVRKV